MISQIVLLFASHVIIQRMVVEIIGTRTILADVQNFHILKVCLGRTNEAKDIIHLVFFKGVHESSICSRTLKRVGLYSRIWNG